MASRNLQARRKLSELYRRGVEVRFGPDGGRVGRLTEPCFDDPPGPDEVAVWIAPPSPLQREMALRDAQAARARALIALKREKNSEEHLTSMAFLAEMSIETLKDYVLMSDNEDRRAEAIRDVLGEEEWKDVTALQDALRQFQEDNTPEDDPEYAAVLERDRVYGRQVKERLDQLLDAARDVLALQSREQLEQKALEQRADLVGSQRFMTEFERQMTFYSIREIDNRATLFFDSVKEFSEQDDIIQDTIKEALSLFINDGNEAKNSQGAVSGSESSELPSEPETSEASTPTAVNA